MGEGIERNVERLDGDVEEDFGGHRLTDERNTERFVERNTERTSDRTSEGAEDDFEGHRFTERLIEQLTD